jgi:hypothetical protein
MRKVGCYMCETKTDRAVTVSLVSTTPVASLVHNTVPLCDRCQTAITSGTIYLELLRLVESK